MMSSIEGINRGFSIWRRHRSTPSRGDLLLFSVRFLHQHLRSKPPREATMRVRYFEVNPPPDWLAFCGRAAHRQRSARCRQVMSPR
jgi:hypothetical protein